MLHYTGRAAAAAAAAAGAAAAEAAAAAAEAAPASSSSAAAAAAVAEAVAVAAASAEAAAAAASISPQETSFLAAIGSDRVVPYFFLLTAKSASFQALVISGSGFLLLYCKYDVVFRMYILLC